MHEPARSYSVKVVEASVPKPFVARVNKLKLRIIAKKIKVWNVITQGYPRWFK